MRIDRNRMEVPFAAETRQISDISVFFVLIFFFLEVEMFLLRYEPLTHEQSTRNYLYEQRLIIK